MSDWVERVLALSFLVPLYLYTKALHILFVIAWMAALLMLPRLLVYHAQHKKSDSIHKLMSVSEKRLITIILFPALLGAVVTGTFLLLTPGLINWQKKAVYVKLFCVLGLITLHFLFVFWSKKLQKKQDTRSHKFYRLMNEVPYVIAIVIVFMAVVKPF